MDELIAKSVRRLKFAFILTLLVTAGWRLLDMPLSWWLLIPLAVLANWAVWPAQIAHWRQFRDLK